MSSPHATRTPDIAIAWPNPFTPISPSQQVQTHRGQYQPKTEQCDRDFADGADQERPRPLLLQIGEVGTQSNSRERQQKSPARKVGEAADLVLAEYACAGE